MVAAFLVSSPRLFEDGLSLDPVLYAVVARNFAENGSWWTLTFGRSLFPQFFEQPFLIFWIQGIVFKLFGATDFTARFVGLAFGSATFYYFFRLVERLASRFQASVFCLLCLLDANFIGRNATPYLEIPLTFFAFATLYYSVCWYRREGGRSGQNSQLLACLLAGICLAGAFLTKGFAALPVLGTIGLWGLFEKRWRLFTGWGLWILLSVAAAIVSAFCWLQGNFGQYPFASLYFQNTFVERTLGVGAGVGPWPFLGKLATYACVSLSLAVVSAALVLRAGANRRVFGVGLLGAFVFTAANAVLGLPFLHYFHGILPFLNLMASVGVAHWLSRWEGKAWGFFALGLGLALHVFWNLSPLTMRRRAPDDFFQLKSIALALTDNGAQQIDVLGIAENDWIYRQFSRWYWRADSRLVDSWGAVESPVVVAARGHGEPPTERRFQRCVGSNRYDIWVVGDRLQTLCRYPYQSSP